MGIKTKAKTLLARLSSPAVVASADTIEKYVFIVTYGRSGSTVLQNLIGNLPGAHIVGENWGVPFDLAKAASGAAHVETKFSEFGKNPASSWYGADKLNSDAFGAGCAQLIYNHFLQPPEGTRIAGFKEVRWASPGFDLDTSIQFLEQHFKPAYFVFNVRDPEATAQSGWWKKRPREETVAHLNDLRNTLIESSKGHPNRVLVDYDMYTKDHSALKPLFDCIGEPYDETFVETIFSQRLNHAGVPGKI